MYQILVILLLTLTSFCKCESYDGFLSPPMYHNYTQLKQLFGSLEEAFPEIAKVYAIGQSVLQRELLVMEINKNVHGVASLTPKFKYVANVYGDEAVGRQLVIYLAQYLLYNYGKLPRITKLVDNTDIFLMPTMNPDGFENADVGMCDDADGKYNEEEVDLNVNFPNMVTGKPDNALVQPETQAMMDWMSENDFILSGNLQGGALRYTYPHEKGGPNYTDNAVPDDKIFKALATLYAQKYPSSMGMGICGQDDNYQNQAKLGPDVPRHKQSVRAYQESTGMHNYNYFGANCIELIFFLSCCNYPQPVELEFEWSKHKESLLSYMEAVHWGVKGIIMNNIGQPIENATVTVAGYRRKVRSTVMGEYFRILTPGKYKLLVNADGYKMNGAIIFVESGVTAFKSFILDRIDGNKLAGDAQRRVVKKQLAKITKNGLYRIRLPVYLLSVSSIINIFVTHWYP